MSTPVKSQRAAALKGSKKYQTQKKKKPFFRYRAKHLFGSDVTPTKLTPNQSGRTSPVDTKEDVLENEEQTKGTIATDDVASSRKQGELPKEKPKKEKKKHRLFRRKSSTEKKNKKDKRMKDSDKDNKMTMSNSRTRTHRDIEDWLKWRSYLNEHLALHVMSGDKLDMNEIPIKSVPETIQTDALKAIIARAYRKDMPSTTLDQIAYVVYGVPRTHLKLGVEQLNDESEATLDLSDEIPEPDYDSFDESVIDEKKDKKSIISITKPHKKDEEIKKQGSNATSRLGPFSFFRKHKDKPQKEEQEEVLDKEEEDEEPPGYAPSMAEIMNAKAHLAPVASRPTSPVRNYRAANVVYRSDSAAYKCRQIARPPSQNSSYMACPSPIMYQGIPELTSVSRQSSSVSTINPPKARAHALKLSPLAREMSNRPPLTREVSNRSVVTNGIETPLVHVPKHAFMGFRYAQLSRHPSNTSSLNNSATINNYDVTPSISRESSNASAFHHRSPPMCPRAPPLPPNGIFRPTLNTRCKSPPTPPPKPFRPFSNGLLHRDLSRDGSNASSYYTIPEHPRLYTGQPRMLPPDLTKAIQLNRKPSNLSTSSSLPSVALIPQ